MRSAFIDKILAQEYINRLHRHHIASIGHRFSIGAFKNDILVGVAMVGNPVARMLNDGKTIEVNRLCTDGTRNACSFLYAASAREAKKRGYQRIVTYILESESGASLRGAGWIKTRFVKGQSWHREDRPRIDKHPISNKWRYDKIL